MGEAGVGEVLGVCVAGWGLFKSSAIGRDPDALLGSWPPDPGALKREAARVAPRDFQRRVVRELEGMAGRGGVLVLEAPTAAGKTEALVAPFLHQAVGGDWWLAPRMVYTLPIRALADSMGRRMGVYARSVSRVLGGPELTVGVEYGSLAGRGRYMYGAVVNVATLDVAVYGYVAQRVPGGALNPRPRPPSPRPSRGCCSGTSPRRRWSR